MAGLKARLVSYSEPALLIALSLFFFFVTLITAPQKVFTPQEFRDIWFSKLWAVLGPKMAAVPYQEPYISQLMGRARGKVLEFGPGTGQQSRHFNASKITHLYGAEPNEKLHPELLKNCDAAGLHKYTILHSGAQPSSLLPELERQGLLQNGKIPEGGLFDTIVTVKSLCSAPQEELADTIALVHRLLKPNGEFIFFEHVHSHDDRLTATLVYLVNLFWPYLMGNCRLDGKLDEYLNKDGAWAEKNISNIREYQGFEPIRYSKGYCRA